MTTPTERVNDLYAQLSPGASAAYDEFILSRTPSDLSTLMAAKMASADVVVTDGDTVNVEQWDGSTVAGTLNIADGVITDITLAVVATKTIIANGDATVAVNDLGDTPVAGSPGVATVAGGALTKVNLTV